MYSSAVYARSRNSVSFSCVHLKNKGSREPQQIKSKQRKPTLLFENNRHSLIMKKVLTFILALAVCTSLWAEDIQFTNLSYIHYGDSVRVQATTSLSDMPMPSNNEYGFEYEYVK